MSRFGESTQAVILTAVDRNEPARIDPALTVGFPKERVISTFAEILRVLHVLAGTLALFSGRCSGVNVRLGLLRQFKSGAAPDSLALASICSQVGI